jgi:hypothetical protein
MPRLIALFICIALGGTGCKTTEPIETSLPIEGPHIQSSIVFSCFEKGLMRGPDKPATCEPSAIALHHGRVILGNDKPIPGDERSPVFSLNLDRGLLSPRPDIFHRETPFLKARKYEDFTTTPDGRWAFATTSFDRILEDDAKWDVFNTLLYWPVNRPAAVSIAQMSTRNDQSSSAGLRAEMKRALANPKHPEGPAYWKVEALAAIPGNILLFGIREVGESYKEFEYSTRILALAYAIDENGFRATGPIEQVFEFDASAVPEAVAISGLEYAPETQTLWLLTSFENGDSAEDIGGYLWSLQTKGLPLTGSPTLLRTHNNTPLKFSHKSEGVTPLGTHQLLIIHDDDRRTGKSLGRELHQAVLEIVQIP